SRRRHTRSKRDWSSDVCSSDLPIENLCSRRTRKATADFALHEENWFIFSRSQRSPAPNNYRNSESDSVPKTPAGKRNVFLERYVTSHFISTNSFGGTYNRIRKTYK